MVPRPFRQIRQAIQVEETDSDDDTETNNYGFVSKSEHTRELKKTRKEGNLNASFLATANMITMRGW